MIGRLRQWQQMMQLLVVDVCRGDGGKSGDRQQRCLLPLAELAAIFLDLQSRRPFLSNAHPGCRVGEWVGRLGWLGRAEGVKGRRGVDRNRAEESWRERELVVEAGLKLYREVERLVLGLF